MEQDYYNTIDQLENMKVDPDYIQGWIGGYLGNPEREEQRVNEAYTAGYEDGKGKQTVSAESWVKT